jgi:sugar phosphate permease
LLFGAGYGLAQTAIDTQIIQTAPSEAKGGVLSIHNSMKFVGTCLSPIVLGIVLSHFDLDTVFIVAGSFGLLIALITYLMKNLFEDSGDKNIKEIEKEIETKVSVSN